MKNHKELIGVIKAATVSKIQRPTKRAPDAGDSAHIPNSFHALAFFWLDGFAVPAPAQVTQAVGRLRMKQKDSKNIFVESDVMTNNKKTYNEESIHCRC